MAGEGGAKTEISGLVNTLQGHVDDIRTQLQCGICIRPLYEPFTLACGHTFCYSCLVSWFSAGTSKRTCPDCRAPVKSQPAPAYLVRTVVQMFTSRAELLDKGETTTEHLTHRQEESGRLDKDKSNTDPQHGGLFGGIFKEKPPPLRPIVDVDDGVMRCPVCNWELADDEVCAGCGYEYHGESDGTDYTDEDSDISETENHDSIIDDEADDDQFGDIEDDDAVWGTFGIPGAFPQDLAGANPAGISWHGGYHPFYQPGSRWPPGAGSYRIPPRPPGPPGVILTDPSEYDEHYGDEENEYEMDSFIDDEENLDGEDLGSQSEHSTVVEGGGSWQPRVPERPIGRYGTDYPNPEMPIDLDAIPTSDEESDGEQDGISGEGEEDEDSDEDEDGVVRRPLRRRLGNFSSDDEEDDMDEDESPVRDWGAFNTGDENAYYDTRSSPTRTEGTEDGEISEFDSVPRGAYQGVINDSEEDESSESSSQPPSRSTRPTTGVTFGNAITIDDSEDEDEDEDEQPVGPVRRTAQRRQHRFSPY